jgi:amino acid adenylation domain-containing protein
MFPPPGHGAAGKLREDIKSMIEQDTTTNTTAASLLTKENIKDIYVLSPMQEGILFHTLLDADSASYFQQNSYRIRGRMDTSHVRKAHQELVARHDILRTVFKYTGVDRPLQIVLQEWKSEFTYEDLRAVEPDEQREAYVSQAKEKDRARLFDLSKDALMRISLFQLGDEEFEFVWSCHHILMDGWCLNILKSEFFEILNSYHERRPYRLPRPRPFSDYIKWLERQDRETARRFWQTYLEGYTEVTSFPTQRIADRQEKVSRPEQVVLRLDDEQTRGLIRLASDSQLTLAQLLNTIWGVLLSKYTGTHDVVYGLVVSGRPSDLEGVEGIIGLFINTIPVRLRFDPDAPFAEVLAQAKEGLLASEEYSYFPLNEMQALSEVKGSLFDHILVFHNLPNAPQPRNDDAAAEGGRVLDKDVFEQTNYPLCIDIGSGGGNIHLAFNFDPGVHERSFIERTARVYEALVAQLLARPDIPVKQVAILTEQARALLDGFNATDRELPLHKSVVRVIEEFAASQADATALVCEERRISYGELNARANQLARYLGTRAEVGGDDRVAILLGRSEVMVESILATWKLGAAYVPVDVEYPADRIKTMIADCGAKLILTDSTAVGAGLLDDLSSLAPTIPLNELQKELAQHGRGDLGLPFEPRSLSYVIYTSGSTGVPKGAMIEHAGMLNHLYAKINDLQLNAESVVVQNASHCFDISVWQFFAALLVGGKTVIYPKDLVLNPEALLERIEADAVTILEFVPTYLSMLLTTGAEEKLQGIFRTLRYLLVTGEAVKPALVNRWFESFPEIPLVNAYGPTEASDDITHYIMTEPPVEETIPIGRPVQNLKIYIADEYLNLCPVGVKGEILVSGVGVGRGYLNDREKTERAFTEDPFRREKGVRLYKTGDIGRFLDDGRIEFFGRKDNQVKVHGFRIELEEIENVITSHPSALEAVVLDKENASGDTYLSGYVIGGDGLDTEALRGFLAAKLPGYMIPSYFTVLAEFPLTANGKVDRKALREIHVAGEEEGASGVYVAPRNETEEKLVRVWQEVLNIPRVGTRDNFFDLGGDSFKAIRVVSKFGKGFLVPDLYKYQTVEQLATFVARNGDAGVSLLYELIPASDQHKYAVVAVPNSAGDPLIYRETSKSLVELTDEFGLYGVVLPRTEPGPGESMSDLLDTLANDIVGEIKKKIKIPVILYGQCNGAGLVLQLALRIEREGIACRAVCFGAQFPKTKLSPEQDMRGDEDIVKFLESLGADYPTSLEDQIIFLRNFRYDGALAKTSYNSCLRDMRKKSFKRLATTVYSIVGDKDPITNNYGTRYRDWERYAEKVGLVVMKDVGHFMWRDKPDELARILFDIGEGRIEVAEKEHPQGLLSKLGALLSSR